MRDFFFFDRMLTPRMITFIYWLLLAVVVISGLGSMFAGAAMGGGFGFGSFIYGLVIIAVGAVMARIWCELLIILFKIHDNTKKMTGQDTPSSGEE